MSLKDRLTVEKITTPQIRERALEVLSVVYQDEKGWVPEREKLLPSEDLQRKEVSWFLAMMDGKPVGVTRVLYELPIQLYQEYGFKLVDAAIDVEAFIRNNKIAEVGRFAVLPQYRDKILIASILMRASATETVQRGFTHYITDVFEADPNSPYKFHKNILGFQEVATHDVGELVMESRRITMLLDLKQAFRRMKDENGWIFRFITEGWSEDMIRFLEA